MDRARKACAEAIGTLLLVAGVVGSGIAAARLSPGNPGLELLENATATAAVLAAMILAVGPVSGAHLNPVVTLADRYFGGLDNRDTGLYLVSQFAGGAAGAVVANLMFGFPAVNLSTHVRTGGPLWLAEGVATFGLVLVVFGVVRSGRHSAAPFAVAAYIAGAYFFTASTSFANPAVTAARTLSNTFAGIDPASVPAFAAAQVLGGAAAVGIVRFLYPAVRAVAKEAVIPHDQGKRPKPEPAPSAVGDGRLSEGPTKW